MKLALSAVSKYLMGLVLTGVLIFLPAGGFDYFGGWLFIALLFIPMLALGLVLFIKAPDLLKKRLENKEREKTQKGVVGLSGLLFLFGFILAGLDRRFGWSEVPMWTVILFSVIFLIFYALYCEVMRENAYLSRTVKVSRGQKVVSTGLYSIVRHPMYFSTVFLFLSIPVILGSWWAILCFAPYPALMVMRIKNEEELLEKELEGYSEYKKSVKYRLIPFIW